MLVDFRVANFRSIKNEICLSMESGSYDKVYLENIIEMNQTKLVKCAAIYGANASGKSNIIDAMSFMPWFVQNSSKEMQLNDRIPVVPFKLDSTSEKAPSLFQACFILDNSIFRYGFECNQREVVKEWLFRKIRNKEEALFLRENDGIEIFEDFSEGSRLEEKTRNNALFLSVVAQFNGKISSQVLKWFSNFGYLSGLRDIAYEKFTAELLQNESTRKILVEFIKRADIGIEDLNFKETASEVIDKSKNSDTIPGVVRSKRTFIIDALHPKYTDGKRDGSVTLDFQREESEGTKKFFRIIGPILDCLANGYVVAIDELDAKLHPLLTKAVVQLFNSKESNPRNSQLIFTTHDTNLLSQGKLRRDQIWFTEKTGESATDLYSLADFKLPDGDKVRKDANYEDNYIKGRYGAIPFIGNFNELLKGE